MEKTVVHGNIIDGRIAETGQEAAKGAASHLSAKQHGSEEIA
jgi:hypothetical protein